MELIGYLFIGIFIVATIGFFGFPKDSKFYKYFKNILIGYDQLLNTFICGYPDETISSRAYKGKLKGHKGWIILSNILDFIDPGHSKRSVEWDEGNK